MGILNDVWWLLGFLMAGPFLVPGAQSLIEGSYPTGALFLACGIGMLFLPEYIRWRLTGGNSVLERVPFLGSRTHQN
ncbi:hypothetical protein G9C85_10880 [Halorubellus sp. JP-L1]|uniref:hypothetical protein n=1 Tax=Halorubellus sp. JP-L1 TaxID=2715753 RepID=UPI00140DB245|nr:hypothetical protein [Halorubellus sp. JP-L1]NHN42127.1 hypothetical protein [Halorubellus sp. JP-L1]